MDFTLNRVFLGSPETGKTSIAKLYGQIFVDIGMLSNEEGKCLETSLSSTDLLTD